MMAPLHIPIANLVKQALDTLAMSYQEACLQNQDMVLYARQAEAFKNEILRADSLAQCWDALDDWSGRCAEAIMNSDVQQQARLRIVEGWLAQYGASVVAAQEMDRLTVWSTAMLELLFTWRTWAAAQWVQQAAAMLPPNVDDEYGFSYTLPLMVERRWVECMPYIDKWKKIPGLSTYYLAHLHTLEADILVHLVGNFTAATHRIKEAQSLWPRLVYAAEIEGRIYLEQHQLVQARDHLQRLLMQYPQHRSIPIALGIALEYDNDKPAAYLHYQQLLHQFPGHTGARHNLLSVTQIDDGDLRIAHKHADTFMQVMQAIEPEGVYDTLITVAGFMQGALLWEPAIAYYQQAISLQPYRPEGWVKLGQLYEAPMKLENTPPSEQEQWAAKAIKEYEYCINLAPGFFDGYWKLALLHQYFKRYEQAIDILQQCLQQCPAFTRLLYMQMAYLHQELNQWPKANACLLQAAAMHTLHDSMDGFLKECIDFYASQVAKQPGGLDEVLGLIEQLRQTLPPTWSHQYYTHKLAVLQAAEIPAQPLLDLLNEASVRYPDDAAFAQQRISYAQKLEKAPPQLKQWIAEGYTAFAQQEFFKEAMQAQVYGPVLEALQPAKQIQLYVHSSIVPHMVQGDNYDFLPAFAQRIDDFKKYMLHHWGIQLPGIQFKEYQEHAGHYDFYTLLDECIGTAGNPIYWDRLLVQAPQQALEALGITAQALTQPYLALPLFWVEQEQRALLLAAGMAVHPPIELLFFHLRYVVWQHLPRFLSFQQAAQLTLLRPQLAEEAPPTTNTVSANTWSTLLQHETPETCGQVLNLYYMLLEHRAQVAKKEEILYSVQQARVSELSLGNLFTQFIQQPAYAPVWPGTMPFTGLHQLSQAIQQTISKHLQTTAVGNPYLALNPNDTQDILAAVRNATPQPGDLIMVDTPEMIPACKALTKMDFPYLQFITPAMPYPAALQGEATVFNSIDF